MRGVAVAACLVLCLGCGGGSGLDTHPVSGKVTIKGGEPVKKGIVQFSNGTYTSIGGIETDGSYTMSSAGEDDGVPPGTYKVVVLNTNLPDIKDDGSMVEIPPVIDARYESPDNSGLTVTVPGDNYDLELDPPVAQ